MPSPLINTLEKKALFLIPSMDFGGAELLMLEQLKGMAQANWKTYVAVLSGKKSNQQLLTSLQGNVEQLLVLNSPESVLSTAALRYAYGNQNTLTGFIRKHNIGLVIAHLPIAHFWGRLVKRKIKIRLVIYHHSMQYQANPLDTLSKKIFNYFLKILARKTDDITICISQSVKQNIEAHFVLINPFVLYNAVQDSSLALSGISKASEADVIRLVLPGRLNPVKGQLFFLPVLKKLLTTANVKVALKIAGGGALEQPIKAFVDERKLGDNVSLTGFLSNDDLLKEMVLADLVIIPSLSEGLGLVAIEALMLGKTIIASDAGGLKEIIRHGQNGYLFKAGDEGACLNTCQAVLSKFPASLFPPALLQEEYKKRFSFESYMRAFLNIISG